MMWVGIASSDQVKEVLDTGVPAVRIVKPYPGNPQAMIRQSKEAEAGGAIAVGTDIDFFYLLEQNGEIARSPRRPWRPRA